MITCQINEIEFTPLAYSNDGMAGRLAKIFLADEAGALDSYPVEAMRSSQITLVNKLGIIISTQYPNDNNVMIDEVDIAKKVLDGVLEKENVFALLYEPDDALFHVKVLSRREMFEQVSHGSKSGTKKLLQMLPGLHSEDDGGVDFRLLLHQRT